MHKINNIFVLQAFIGFFLQHALSITIIGISRWTRSLFITLNISCFITTNASKTNRSSIQLAVNNVLEISTINRTLTLSSIESNCGRTSPVFLYKILWKIVKPRMAPDRTIWFLPQEEFFRPLAPQTLITLLNFIQKLFRLLRTWFYSCRARPRRASNFLSLGK